MDNVYLSQIGQWMPGNTASPVPTNPSVVPGNPGARGPMPSRPASAPARPQRESNTPDNTPVGSFDALFSSGPEPLEAGFNVSSAPMADRPAQTPDYTDSVPAGSFDAYPAQAQDYADSAPAMGFDAYPAQAQDYAGSAPAMGFDAYPAQTQDYADSVSVSAFDVFRAPDNEPETLSSPIYTPGFLRTQIGRTMRVEFLVGHHANSRVGRLMQVGASYILLESVETRSAVMCDLYSIRFVTILPEDTYA